MQYLNMNPRQLREAIERRTPVALPLGVVEYHAEHLPFGTDAFIAMDAIRRVEQRHPELIVLPPFYYGAASLAVAAPENNGTIQVDAMKLIPVAEEIFKSLLRIGLRGIHAFIAHQTEEFEQGMPTDLAFRMAGRHAIFDYLEKNSGEGWWGTEQFSAYYSGDNNPFAWIQIHPVRTRPETNARFHGDHAGKLETSAMLAMHPELVHMDQLDPSLWYSRPAADASAEYGEAYLDAISYDVEAVLFGKK